MHISTPWPESGFTIATVAVCKTEKTGSVNRKNHLKTAVATVPSFEKPLGLTNRAGPVLTVTAKIGRFFGV
uniref:Uncharacterized protein n=1 Tax=Arundo donax TaxID=35708 RepID=A0A0A9EPM9_ARUDO